MVVGPEEASVEVRSGSYFDGHEQAAVVVPDSNELICACRESIALCRVFRCVHPNSSEHGHTHEHKGSAPSSRPASVHAVQSNNDDLVTFRNRSTSYSSLYGHPIATRASLVQTAQDIATSSLTQDNVTRSSEETPLLGTLTEDTSRLSRMSAEHGHGRTHVHGSMNMQALVLHVLGDALSSIGVIATGLVIWLTTWKYKFYFDPVISLVITMIISSSALPSGVFAGYFDLSTWNLILAPPPVRSTSFILLQGVPPTISLDKVRESILKVNGVLSVHDLHIWQLSESMIVSSVHVILSVRRLPLTAENWVGYVPTKG